MMLTICRTVGAGAPLVRCDVAAPAQYFGACMARHGVLRTHPGAILHPATGLGGVVAYERGSFPHPLSLCASPFGVFGATHIPIEAGSQRLGND